MIFHSIIENAYRKMLFSRCDDTGLAFYFSHKDFDGLMAEEYSFATPKGDTLRGAFYSYPHARRDRLLVFDHGFGGGHRSYMREIERLARAGYRVFAYDHTGCMTSSGESAGGFSQSPADLDACLTALKADPNVNTADLSVIGHSWGGFATLNSPALHPDIKRIVVLSGFVSVPAMIAQNFGGILSGYRKHIYALEAASNPDYVTLDAVKTLADSDTRALLIYSDNDPLVKKEVHYDALYAALSEKDNVEFLLTKGKGHNPNYTHDAVSCLAVLAKETKKKRKKLKTPEDREAFRRSFDWYRMTEQDEAVFEKILAFLA